MGNGGILRDLELGPLIDRFDTIIRLGFVLPVVYLLLCAVSSGHLLWLMFRFIFRLRFWIVCSKAASIYSIQFGMDTTDTRQTQQVNLGSRDMAARGDAPAPVSQAASPRSKDQGLTWTCNRQTVNL